MTHMHLKGLRRLAMALTMSAIPAISSAQVVYSNGLPDNRAGLPMSGNFTAANDFNVSQTTQLTSFDWYAMAAGDNGPATITASYFWKILYDNGGLPGGVLAEGVETDVVGTLSPFNCCIPDNPNAFQTYLFNTAINNLTVGLGSYWLAVGGFTTDYSSPHYYWASSNGIKGNESKRWDDGEWRTMQQEGAFIMYGTNGQDVNIVPEPASLLLLGSGLSGLGGYMARKRKAAKSA